MNDTVLSLLHKVKELAERGVDGERLVAQEKLIALMRKYRITPADLENEEVVEVRFKYRTMNEKVLGICLAQVCCGRRDVPCRVLPKKTILIYMTKSEHKEWAAIYGHYVAALRKDARMFLVAFLHRNEIEPPFGGKCRRLSVAETIALMKMMGYMERCPYLKPRTMIGGR